MKHLLFITMLLGLLGFCAVQAPHAGHPLDRAGQLYSAGETAEALQAVHEYLRDWPNEPRGMFLRGLILERMGQRDEAMAVYRELIRIHPRLPEPYNNLAGLLAAQGRYEEAKEVLHQALQTHPSYAAAHQNLSKIYSAMASQAYRRVLGAEDEAVRVSLFPLEELSSLSGVTLLAELPPPAPPSAEALNAPVVAQTQTDSPPGMEPAPRSEADHGQPQRTDAATPVLAAPADQARQEPGRESRPAPPRPVEPLQEMQALLQAWAKAWAGQDVQAYLGFYSDSFAPEGGLTHDLWREQRKIRVSAPSFIKITLSDVTVEKTDPDAALVHFTQHYSSNVINDQVRKEIFLQKENGQWRIVRERLLSR